jgi:CMP-2-keto-3-deoxyoctulosonic acid synthetase
MDLLKAFSTNYANAISAIATCLALLLAVATLWFLKREYENKYRPYVVPGVMLVPITETADYALYVLPRNVGPHPCEFMLRDIQLHVGDETYDTPNFKEWVLIAPQGMEVHVPVGRVNEIGIKQVREARYKTNRIEIAFKLLTRSADHRYEQSKVIAYEVNVQGQQPFIAFRPDWHKDA